MTKILKHFQFSINLYFICIIVIISTVIIIIVVVVVVIIIIIIIIIIILFLFNIYVLAVVITVISSVRRVVTNDQRLSEYSRLYISNTFLSILAVPNKAVFCITPTLHVIPSFPIHLSNSAETLPRAPITTETISTFLNFHNLLISLFKSWYFSTFSFSFSSILTSAGTAISIIFPFCSFLSITIRSGRLGRHTGYLCPTIL